MDVNFKELEKIQEELGDYCATLTERTLINLITTSITKDFLLKEGEIKHILLLAFKRYFEKSRFRLENLTMAFQETREKEISLLKKSIINTFSPVFQLEGKIVRKYLNVLFTTFFEDYL